MGWPVILVGSLVLSVLDATGRTIAELAGKASAPTPAADARAQAEAVKPSVLSLYRALRERMPDTAEAHRDLGLWCRQNGLAIEAVIQGRLQVEAQKRELRTQKKWLGA